MIFALSVIPSALFTAANAYLFMYREADAQDENRSDGASLRSFLRLLRSRLPCGDADGRCGIHGVRLELRGRDRVQDAVHRSEPASPV